MGGEAWLVQLHQEEREKPAGASTLPLRKAPFIYVFSVAKASASDRDPLTKDKSKKRSSTATKALGASLLGPVVPECVSHE